MRILHVLHSHGYGGAENHALLLMGALRQAGHEVMLAAPRDSWLFEACRARGMDCEHLRMSGLYDPFSHLKLRALVRRWRPDVVHGHLIRGAHYAGCAAPRRGRPAAVCTAHATTARTHMQRCRRIIAVSGAVRDQLLAHGYAPDRVTVIHNGVPDRPLCSAAERAQLRRELGVNDDVFAVVNVGRFVRDKGQDLLVQALRRLEPRVHLYLIGDADTVFGAEVRAGVQDPSRVHFLGYRADVQRLLPAFDAYALSSRREALGLSLVEAFAASLPVVATAVGGVPELVSDRLTGLLVPPEQATALAEAVALLARDQVLARTLAAAGRERFERDLTVEHMVQATVAVYSLCLEGLDTPSARGGHEPTGDHGRRHV